MWSCCNPAIDTRTIYVGNIYRPPDGSINDGLSQLEYVLVDITSLGLKDIILLGDLNINLYNNDPQVKNYLSLLKTYGLQQYIKSATCVTRNRASLIDHFSTNRQDLYRVHGILEYDIADHSHILYQEENRNQVTSPEVQKLMKI